MVNILNLSLKDFGLKENYKISETKTELQKIINTSTERELKIYLTLIEDLKKFL